MLVILNPDILCFWTLLWALLHVLSSCLISFQYLHFPATKWCYIFGKNISRACSLLKGLCEKPYAPNITHKVWKILVDCAGPSLFTTTEKGTWNQQNGVLAELVKKSPPFTKPECLLPCSVDTLQPHIHFSIILPFTPISASISLPFRCSNQNRLCTLSCLLHAPPILPSLIWLP